MSIAFARNCFEDLWQFTLSWNLSFELIRGPDIFRSQAQVWKQTYILNISTTQLFWVPSLLDGRHLNSLRLRNCPSLNNPSHLSRSYGWVPRVHVLRGGEWNQPALPCGPLIVICSLGLLPLTPPEQVPFSTLKPLQVFRFQALFSTAALGLEGRSSRLPSTVLQDPVRKLQAPRIISRPAGIHSLCACLMEGLLRSCDFLRLHPEGKALAPASIQGTLCKLEEKCPLF